jgi:hypothetical protein
LLTEIRPKINMSLLIAAHVRREDEAEFKSSTLIMGIYEV